MDKSFEVPPFDPGRAIALGIRYVWWSWHPNYPYWSKSCWSADSIEEAQKLLESPQAAHLDLYHNKLIREGDGAFTEVLDRPCERTDVWEKIAEIQKKADEKS